MGEIPTQLTKEEFESWQDGKIKEVDGVKLCPPPRELRHNARYMGRYMLDKEDKTSDQTTDPFDYAD